MLTKMHRKYVIKILFWCSLEQIKRFMEPSIKWKILFFSYSHPKQAQKKKLSVVGFVPQAQYP